jgi:hypothetical protein
LFLPEILPYVADVPVLIAVNAVRNATIEFCTETRYLQTDLDPMPGVAGESDYDLETDTGYKVVDIMQAWYGQTYLIPRSPDQLSNIYRVTDWRSLNGNPYYYFRQTEAQITLVPQPQTTEADKIKIRAAITPTRASTTIKEPIYERFLEFIAFGARARLYDTPGQPYYSAENAALYRKKFNDVVADVRTKVNKGLTRTSVSVEYQRIV